MNNNFSQTEILALSSLLEKHKFMDYRFIDPADITVAEWVRFKCRFGCPSYGKKAICPPNLPPVAVCREFVHEYRLAVLIRHLEAVETKEARRECCNVLNKKQIEMEKDLFFAGYYKAFRLGFDSCDICGIGNCILDGTDMKDSRFTRPSPEGIGIDVFGIAKKAGFDISILLDYNESLLRYSIFLID